MSSITVRERPGVYSQYDATSVLSGERGRRTVGIAAAVKTGTVLEATVFTSYDAAVQSYGEATEVCAMTELIRLALINGAASVIAVPAKAGAAAALEDYKAAFAVLQGRDDVDLVICDSGDENVQQALKESVADACEARRERIAVVGIQSNVAADLQDRAEQLNCERVVLAAPGVLSTGGDALSGIYTAAALAGCIAREPDPAVPLNGAELKGLGGTAVRYTDNELDLLIAAGVTVAEQASGVLSVVRGVTTRTTTAGVPDTTWRELTTILIIDDVVPGIRDALRAKFARSKNTAQTRSAIRSRVIVELESRKTAEILDDYGEVTVSQSQEDPTICIVDFAFDVAHGLNQIHLYAHVTV